MGFIGKLFGTKKVTQLRASDKDDAIVAEMETVIGRELLADLLRERNSERNWRNFKRIVVSGSFVVLFGIYVGFYMTNMGYKIVPNSDIVGVIRVTGAIEEGAPTASADAVIPVMAKAFSKPNVKAIVVAIDSPGGRPGESERIYNYMDAKKKETGKPVHCVIGNTGASAAYMIAAHCDKIYAGKYSIVGSIGAILQGWDFHKVVERFEVQRKVYASGTLKGMLDPWSTPTAEADAKAQDMVNTMGQRFAKEVRDLRGDKLSKSVNLFTGEVWTGEQAKALGLVDEVNTLDTVVKENWHLGYHDFGPTKASGGFSLPFLSSVTDSVVESVARVLIREAKSH